MIAETTPTTEMTRGQTMDTVQVITSMGDVALSDPRPAAATYAVYRAVRKDPTVALARILSAAPVLTGSWTMAAADDADADEKRVEFIKDMFVDLRRSIMEPALYFGHCDFGWQGFEKIFAIRDGKVHLVRLKQLLHDLTQILIVQETGAFAGFHQPFTDVRVPLENSFLIPFQVEGTQWHGSGLLENVRAIYDSWQDCNDGAKRYDKKIAGSHFVVKFPLGQTQYNGTMTDNAIIAKAIIAALESSGSIGIPHHVKEAIGEIQKHETWELDILSDKGPRQASFVQRLEYLDVQKVRGLLMPERTMLEGKFGTKAEAGEHIDLAFTIMELTDAYITELVNWHCVDQILVLNYGEEARGTVWLEPAPLVDSQKTYLREIYAAFLKNPAGFMEEYDVVDTVSLRERLGVPALSEEQLKQQERDDLAQKIIDEAANVRQAYGGENDDGDEDDEDDEDKDKDKDEAVGKTDERNSGGA